MPSVRISGAAPAYGSLGCFGAVRYVVALLARSLAFPESRSSSLALASFFVITNDLFLLSVVDERKSALSRAYTGGAARLDASWQVM